MGRLLLVSYALLAACSNSEPGPTQDLSGADFTANVTDLAGDAANDTDGGGSCGSCPATYTCGSANGHAVCRAPSGVPLFSRVVVVMMENTSLSTLQAGASSTPYLVKLGSTWATGSDYHGVTHPSLPNYIALTSGSYDGIGCDCNPTGTACTALTCNAVLSSCSCEQTASNLADQMETAGKPWRAYGESMGAACNTTTSGMYAARHVPFLYYQDILGNATRCSSHVVDYSMLAADLTSSPPALIYVAPNLKDDMHDPEPATTTNLGNGDTWLSTNLPPLIAAAGADGLVVVVWDEDDLSGLLVADAPIPIYIVSPLAKASGYVSAVHADHYALLATIEDGLGLPRLGSAATATPLSDYFPAN
jgi:hypothetical protein